MPLLVRGGGGGKNTKDATAVPGDVRNGKTFYGANGKQTGIWTPKVTDYTGDATAVSGDVANGKVFYGKNGRQVGINDNPFSNIKVTILPSIDKNQRRLEYDILDTQTGSSRTIHTNIFVDDTGGHTEGTNSLFVDSYSSTNIIMDIFYKQAINGYQIFGIDDGDGLTLAYSKWIENYGTNIQVFHVREREKYFYSDRYGYYDYRLCVYLKNGFLHYAIEGGSTISEISPSEFKTNFPSIKVYLIPK